MDKKRVAIVGCGDSRDHVRRLYYNLDKYEIWGLNQLYMLMPDITDKATRWFQIHHEHRFMEGDPNTIAWMKKDHGFPIYVREEYVDEYPNAVAYPKHEIISKFGRYFTSQIAWMMALAIHEGFEEVHLYGIHMARDDEYYMQKGCIEYFLGMMDGMGIKYFNPPHSEILHTSFLYGFEDPSPLQQKIMCDIEVYDRKLAHNRRLLQKNRDTRNQVLGHLDLLADEDERKIAKKRLVDLMAKEKSISETVNQCIGYQKALEYLKQNWIFTMGEIKDERNIIQTESVCEDSCCRRNESTTDDREGSEKSECCHSSGSE